MSKLVAFWRKDTLNKLITAAVVINAASLITIAFMLTFSPMGAAVQANLFPTPTFSPEERVALSQQTVTAQSVVLAANLQPTITTMPFTPLVETPRPTPTLTPTYAPPTQATIRPAATATPTLTATYPPPSSSECLAQKTPQVGTVVDIVNGNTVRVLIDQLVYSVRYVGITLPSNPDYASLSAAVNGQLVFGKEVKLLPDSVIQDEEGILYRYVIVGETLVNQELIRSGLAMAATDTPSFDCLRVFQHAEQEAQAARNGAWQLVAPFPPED